MDWESLFQGLGNMAGWYGGYLQQKQDSEASNKARGLFQYHSQRPGITQEQFLGLAGRQQPGGSSEAFNGTLEKYSKMFPNSMEVQAREQSLASQQAAAAARADREQRVKQGNVKTIAGEVADEMLADIQQGAPTTADRNVLQQYYRDAVSANVDGVGMKVTQRMLDYNHPATERDIETALRLAKTKVVNSLYDPEDPVNRLAGQVAEMKRSQIEEARQLSRMVNLTRQENLVNEKKNVLQGAIDDIQGVATAYGVTDEKWDGRHSVGDPKKYPSPKGSVLMSDRDADKFVESQYIKYGRDAAKKFNDALSSMTMKEVYDTNVKRDMGVADVQEELTKVTTTLLPYIKKKITAPAGGMFGILSVKSKEDLNKMARDYIKAAFPVRDDFLRFMAQMAIDNL